jgi:hypothetical protein
MKKKKSAIELSVEKYASILIEGTVLSIDPSIGSRESQPGWALFKKGNLITGGTIKITPGKDVHSRLFDLRQSLMNEFETPDLLITENIPPFMSSGFTGNLLSLHYSVGVILSVFLCPVIRVAPVSWKKEVEDGYKKTDMNDAIMLGFTVVKRAFILYNRDIKQLSKRVKEITCEHTQ